MIVDNPMMDIRFANGRALGKVEEGFASTLVVGDQVFINAYLLATTVFARQGTLSGSKFARYTAEIMATEAVHRAKAWATD